MGIEQLLGPVPVAVFVEEHYLKLPFAREIRKPDA
jgi:hypothetical protein